jgi:hypothetical protein
MKIDDNQLKKLAEGLAAKGAAVTNRTLKAELKERFGFTASSDRIASVVRQLQVRQDQVAAAASQVEAESGETIEACVPEAVRLSLLAVCHAVVGELALIERSEADRHRRIVASLERENAEHRAKLEAEMDVLKASLDAKERIIQEEAAAEIKEAREQAALAAEAACKKVEDDWQERRRAWDAEKSGFQAARDSWDEERRMLSAQIGEVALLREEYEKKLEIAAERTDSASERLTQVQTQLLSLMARADAWRERAEAAEARLLEATHAGTANGGKRRSANKPSPA